MWKRAITYASNDLVTPLTNRKTLRVGVKNKPSDIFSGHHRELLAKQRLEVRENNMGPGVIVILYGNYLDNTLS